MLMQNFGVTNKEYYAMLWYFLEWSIAPETRLKISHLLPSCRQLLLDCGIGVSSSSPGSNDLSSDPIVSQHRVLLFCQLKSMLDIVENDLLK